jgi:hypothetical protein
MFDVAFPPALGSPDIRAAFATGEGSVRVRTWFPQEREMSAESAAGGTVVVRTFYYPSWHVYVDGKPAQARPEEGSGVIALELPPGRHDIVLRFEASSTVAAGEYVSLGAAALALALAVFMRGRQPARVPDGVN